MSAIDTAKDVVHLATAAGLAKDVTDPLQAKLSLLIEQVVALEKENATLKRENGGLKSENTNLQTLVQNLRPKSEELSQRSIDILKLFFDRAGGFSAQQIAEHFRLNQSVADYHVGLLHRKNFIAVSRAGIKTLAGSTPMMFSITFEGREYIARNLTTG